MLNNYLLFVNKSYVEEHCRKETWQWNTSETSKGPGLRAKKDYEARPVHKELTFGYQLTSIWARQHTYTVGYDAIASPMYMTSE